MAWIEKKMKVLFMFFLKLGNRHLLLPYLRCIVGHLFGQFWIFQRANRLKPLHLAVLLAWNALEEVAAVDDLVDRLLKRNAGPFPFASLTGSLEHFNDPVGIIGRLNSSLSL